VARPETLILLSQTHSTTRLLKVHKGSRPQKERPVTGSLLAAWGGRSLAAVVLQFTAGCSQHRSVEGHSQLGKTLELTSGEVIGSRSGTAIRSAKSLPVVKSCIRESHYSNPIFLRFR
jgi:hypothetical protein